MFDRTIYIDKIRPFINKNLIKVLIGQRRVGKSMVLKLIVNEIKKMDSRANIIFIDMEDLDFEELKNYKKLNSFIKNHSEKGMNYLFIDEIQEVENFELVLRNFVKKENFDIYCTGSNAKIYSNEISTYLTGRQISIQIGSLNFKEFCEFHNLPEDKTALQKYIKYGGLPYLIHLPENDEIRFEYLNNIFSTIILRDVVNRHQIRDPRFLIDLLKFLADNTGSLFSATKISKYLKSQNINKNVALILNYISFIEDAFFINTLQRKDIQGKKIFEVGEKYYFEDIGLRNAIMGFKIQDISSIMENIVYLHLRNLGFELSVGYSNNKEIDFIAEKDNEKKYFQVAYLLSDNKTIEREFGNLVEIKDNYPKYVISFDEFKSNNSYYGIKHLTLLEFLTNFSKNN